MASNRWLCQKCHSFNSAYAVKCAFCATPKPQPPEPKQEETKKS